MRRPFSPARLSVFCLAVGISVGLGSCRPASQESDRPAPPDAPANATNDQAPDQTVDQTADSSPDYPAGPSEEAPPPEPDLGPPLVDQPEGLQRLHQELPIWFDKTNKSVVMVGAVCQRYAPLELFACVEGTKEHEAVLAIKGYANDGYSELAVTAHTGLLAAGAAMGGPVQFSPEFVPPSGTEIEVSLIWKDEEGKTQRALAQDWVRNSQSGSAMSAPWVFAGSRFVTDEETKMQYYMADVEGDLISVANFSSALLDIPVESTDADAALMFDAFTERIPPRGTPVTVVLKPKLSDASKDEKPAADAAPKKPSTPAGD